jgi:hypothetical protein
MVRRIIKIVSWLIGGEEHAEARPLFSPAGRGVYEVTAIDRLPDGEELVYSDTLFVGEKLLAAGQINSWPGRVISVATGEGLRTALGFDITEENRVAMRIRGPLGPGARLVYDLIDTGNYRYVELRSEFNGWIVESGEVLNGSELVIETRAFDLDRPPVEIEFDADRANGQLRVMVNGEMRLETFFEGCDYVFAVPPRVIYNHDILLTRIPH